jgi:16S rRNA (guanine1207-N2)-methyltransferase
VTDPASEILFLPLQAAAIAWPGPGRTLILGGRAGLALNAARAQAPVIEQDFKPWADALERDGFVVADAVEGPAVDGTFPLVLVRAPRQRLESRARLARALAMAGDDGVVVACAGNDEGGRSLQADLAQLAGVVQHDSKAHCRVVWTAPGAARHAPELLHEWRQLDAPRPILDGGFVSRPGLFAWDRIDIGSELLIDSLSPKLSGHGADFGAGFGVLAKAVLARAPGVTALDLFEAQARALALARVNLADARVPLQFHWHDVATGVPGRYDFIVSNPPFHTGRADDPGLGRAFIAAAAKALRAGGRLWLVANRHLPYEQALAQDFASVRVDRDAAGFKVIEAIRGER